MKEVIGDILPVAVAAAISPIPIIAVILMLVTKRARVNGPAFILGWLIGLAAIGIVVLAVANPAGASDNGAPSDSANWTQIGLGVLVLALAARTWRKRPRGDEAPEMPKWMGAIEEFTPIKAIGAGVALSAVNPKNLILSISAATTIAATDLSGADQAIAYTVFALIATLGVLTPVVIYFALGDRAPAVLADLKAFLLQHNAAIMTALLLVIGAKILGAGIATL